MLQRLEAENGKHMGSQVNLFFCQSIHLLCSQQISLEKLHNRDSARYWGWSSKWHQQETLPWLIFTLYWLYVSRLRRLSHPFVSSALIPRHFRRLTWHNQITVTIIAIQFFFPYLIGTWRKAVGGKSRACLQVNLLVSRHHAVCNGTIDNRTCPSSTGNLLTSCRKRPRHVAAKTESAWKKMCRIRLPRERNSNACWEKERKSQECPQRKWHAQMRSRGCLVWCSWRGSINEQGCQYSGSIM